jgi:hypothetical protein
VKFVTFYCKVWGKLGTVSKKEKPTAVVPFLHSEVAWKKEGLEYSCYLNNNNKKVVFPQTVSFHFRCSRLCSVRLELSDHSPTR